MAVTDQLRYTGGMTTNPLHDVVPARARKYVYAIVAFAAIAVGAWEASQGDVGTFIASLVTALVTAMAASNTPANAG